jgi:hypothetical protein
MSLRRLYRYLFPFFQFQLLFSSCIPSFKQCGCSHEQPIFSQSRIVGGYTARAHSWPWIGKYFDFSIKLILYIQFNSKHS